MASTLGVANGDAPVHEHDGPADSGGHADHDHGPEETHAREAAARAERDELHPWAKEMYRQGLSFNGNERSKLFLGRGDGSFLDFSDLCGADSPLDGRGLVCADFDDDGDVDLFVHNLQRERHNLYRNELGAGGFLKIRLRATRSQHEAIGAVVTVDGPHGPTAQVVSRGAGYASCQAPELVFGLGAAEAAEVRVFWPGGVEESFGRVGAGKAVTLVEGSGKAQVRELQPVALRDPLPQGLKRDLGSVLPDVVLETAAGERTELRWAELAAGRTLYLNLWASYCRPCVAEIPDLERVHRDPTRSVLSISVDVPEARATALEVLERAGASYPVYFMGMDDEEGNRAGIDEVVDLMRLPIPTTLVVSPEGRLLDVVRGPLTAAGGGVEVAAGE